MNRTARATLLTVRVSGLTIGGVLAGAVGLTIIAVAEGFWTRARLEPMLPVGLRGVSGTYGDQGGGEPIELGVLGDSLAVGVGATRPEDTIGVLVATALAYSSTRPIRLRNHAAIGGESQHLPEQVAALLETEPTPNIVLIVVGGNEVTGIHRIGAGLRHLSETVRGLRHVGTQVVVATCPDLGTVRSFGQPLRSIAHWLSLLLATAQTIVVLRAGGRTVSLADTLGPDFRARPADMFSADRMHPSSAGYARAAEVLLPSVRAAASPWTGEAARGPRRVYVKTRRTRLAWLAFRAARHAGAAVVPVAEGRPASRISHG